MTMQAQAPAVPYYEVDAPAPSALRSYPGLSITAYVVIGRPLTSKVW